MILERQLSVLARDACSCSWFLLWLLSDILLPFVAGLALAYLQAPLADRLERAGINRTVAALLIVGVVVLTFIVLALLLVPILAAAGCRADRRHPDLCRRACRRSCPIRAAMAAPGSSACRRRQQDHDRAWSPRGRATWLTVLLHSLWSGGKALASFISMLVVMPVVTFYLICDWHEMVETLDGWVPLQHRETVRQLVARDRRGDRRLPARAGRRLPHARLPITPWR